MSLISGWRRLVVVALASAFLSMPGNAQNKGRDPAKFVLTHFERHGQWDLFCGHFAAPDKEFCETRRTDILSPRPNFRAMVIYLRHFDDGPRLTVDAERTTFWVAGGLRLDGRWFERFDRCVNGRCVVQGGRARAFIERVRAGASVALSLVDLTDARTIDWEAEDLRAAIAALDRLRRQKNLP